MLYVGDLTTRTLELVLESESIDSARRELMGRGVMLSRPLRSAGLKLAGKVKPLASLVLSSSNQLLWSSLGGENGELA